MATRRLVSFTRTATEYVSDVVRWHVSGVGDIVVKSGLTHIRIGLYEGGDIKRQETIHELETKSARDEFVQVLIRCAVVLPPGQESCEIPANVDDGTHQ